MGKDRKQPVLYVIAGPNGSGKSSITKELDISDKVGGLIINPDIYAEKLDIADSLERSIAAAKIAEEDRESLLRKGVSFAFETVGSTRNKVDFINKAKDAGYRIFLIFITTGDPQINISRVEQRVRMGGHSVPCEKVKSRYERTMNMLSEYLELSDEACLYDNSGEHPHLVLRKKGEDVRVIRNPDKVQWVKALIGVYPHACSKVLDDPKY